MPLYLQHFIYMGRDVPFCCAQHAILCARRVTRTERGSATVKRSVPTPPTSMTPPRYARVRTHVPSSGSITHVQKKHTASNIQGGPTKWATTVWSKTRIKSYQNLSMRLEFFVKLKYESSTITLFVCIWYSAWPTFWRQ